MAIVPDFPGAHSNLGNAMASQGKLQEAIAYYTEALRLNPRDSDVRRNLERVRRRVADSGKSS